MPKHFCFCEFILTYITNFVNITMCHLVRFFCISVVLANYSYHILNKNSNSNLIFTSNSPNKTFFLCIYANSNYLFSLTNLILLINFQSFYIKKQQLSIHISTILVNMLFYACFCCFKQNQVSPLIQSSRIISNIKDSLFQTSPHRPEFLSNCI